MEGAKGLVPAGGEGGASHGAGWCSVHAAPSQGRVMWGVGGHEGRLREALHKGSGGESCVANVSN